MKTRVGPGPGVLGVFPSFDSPVFGGVQASGREGWQGILNRSADPHAAEAFFHNPDTSRIEALVRAVLWRGDPDQILVWHCGLLKLVPFLKIRFSGVSRPRRALFLHGVEVWRKHDALTTRLMRDTDLFLTNSDHTWRRFLEFHPECGLARHVTVHLGLGESLAEAPGVPEGPPAALMIGRMQRGENYKGHREMISVWPRVLESMPDAELWIAGGGDLRPELERLVTNFNLGGKVRFFGAVPEEFKQDLIRRSRLLALPSAGEGFGLVYLEAMRMGRPCLVSTLDAGAEVVNPPEAGLAVDLQDPPRTADAVIRLMTAGNEWNQVAARAKQRYDARFTGRHFQDRLVAALGL